MQITQLKASKTELSETISKSDVKLRDAWKESDELRKQLKTKEMEYADTKMKLQSAERLLEQNAGRNKCLLKELEVTIFVALIRSLSVF